VHRRTPLAHIEDLQALDATLDEDDAPETHLYLTDYQSLYVGDLGEIHWGDLPQTERAHVPGYYAEDRLECDCWFKLWDIRRLVADDIFATIQELKQLRNIHYHDQPVSLYGGMVDLPLIVTRPDGARFFDEHERDVVADAYTWAQFDAQMGAGLMAVERALCDDLLGERVWGALDPAVRTFIATSEKVYRDHRNDASFDFAPVLGSFGKAIEVQVASLLRAVLPRIPRSVRLMNADGQTIDLAERRSWSLHEVVQVLAGDQERNRALADAVQNGAWFTGQFPAVLDAFRLGRNEATHASRIDRRTATSWRNRLLGVGCVGEFVELSRVKLK
jgi:hypothetical protein